MAVAPCTGNTLAKLAAGITDTPVTLAVKAHLKSAADGHSRFHQRRSVGFGTEYRAAAQPKEHLFVPMKQDDPRKSRGRWWRISKDWEIPSRRPVKGGRYSRFSYKKAAVT